MGEHFQIVGGAHVEALRFQLLALFAQFCQAFVEFLANGFERPFHAFGAGHIMRGREDVDFVFLVDLVAGQRVQRGDAVNLVAEEFDAHGQFLVDGDDFDRIAAHAEGAAREGDVVALVLHGHELAQQVVAVDFLPDFEEEHATGVFFRRAQAVDAGDGGHNHAVAAGQQVCGGLVAQALHIVVDVGVLFYIGVGLRDVCLGLVVVVVAHEVAHGVVRHEFAEFGA